jgi:hypothetical protein
MHFEKDKFYKYTTIRVNNTLKIHLYFKRYSILFKTN